MTTTYSPAVQELVDVSARAGQLGNIFVADAFEKPLTAEVKAGLVLVMERNVEIQKAAYEWSKGERNFDTWLALYNSSQENISCDLIDPTGELLEMSKIVWPVETLKAYYDEIIAPLDMSSAGFLCELMAEGLEHVKAMEVTA